jgi:hypothetical protein
VNEAELIGLRLALVVTHRESNDEESVAFHGRVVGVGDELVVSEAGNERTFVVPRDWLPRILANDDELRTILPTADAWTMLSCEPVPDSAEQAALKATGLKWPEGSARDE